MEKETPEDEADSIESLADKLATLNQRLIPGQEALALELAKAWLADPKRDDVNLAVTLASAGASECTAKEARKENKGVLWKLSAKFDAEYFAHIRPEYVARCETGIPITLAERKEMRGNSWEVAYLARHLDDGALLSAAKYAGDNSRICLSRVTRWDVPTTYDDSVFMIYLPLLLERVEKLRQHNALMREELIRLASSPAVKGEVEMMRILSVADNAAVEMVERAVRFDTDKAAFVELAPPMPGPYSGDTKAPPLFKKHRAEGCKVQLQIAESTRYPGKPSIRVVGASGIRSPSHEFREALISAGFQIGDRAELRLLQETPAEVVRCGCWPGDLKGPCTNLAKGPEGCGDEEHGRGGQHRHVCTGCDNCNDAPAREAYTRAEEKAWARTLQDAGVVTRNTQDDLHSPGCVSPENHNGPCPTGGFVKPSEPAQLSLDRMLDSPAAAGSHEPPQCTHCDKPATCIGAYEDPSGIPEPACDDCCAHGNEDGYCNPINKETT